MPDDKCAAKEAVPGIAPLLRHGGDEDEYLLRGLLWCDLCSELMLPVLISTGKTAGWSRQTFKKL
jgi:hypothetical protein